MDEMFRQHGKSIKDKIIAVSGSGNVATYAVEKAQELGGKVVSVSDSDGYIYDAAGIDIAAVKEIKEVKRGRISEYKNYRPNAVYTAGKGIWNIKCDIACPCATQNEVTEDDANVLVKNGCSAVVEGSNMSSTLEASEVFLKSKILYAPSKAANAGGVATSALEMSQNSMRLSWSFEEVDSKLRDIMINIHKNCYNAAEQYGFKGNYVVGANIAGFTKVADTMLAHGIV